MKDTQLDMFPDVVSVRPEPEPEPCEYPYFIAAYWPRDKRWKVFSEMYSDIEGIAAKRDEQRLREKGWQQITFLRLPDLWSNRNQEDRPA